MGIEAIGSAVSQSYQSSASPKPAADTTGSAVAEVVESSQSETLNQSAAVGQPAATQQNYKDSEDKKKGETTMKDVNEINKLINHNTVAEFGYNEPTNRITIKIKDKDTDEVIKEIPSEKALEMLARAWELAGLLVDERR